MINPVKIAAGYCILLVATILTQVAAYAILPTNLWFQYETMKVEGYIQPGGPIPVISVFNRYRITDMDFTDVLYCDVGDGNGMQYYSVSKSEFPGAPPTEGVKEAPWKYQGKVPKSGVCFLRSATRAAGPFGILTSPPDVKESNLFRIGKPNE